MNNFSTREIEALAALEAATSGDEWKFVRSLNLPGSPIGWGITLAALERKGVVESMYPSVESTGVPKVWRRVNETHAAKNDTD